MSGGLRLFGVWTSVGCECRAVWFGWVVVCGFMTALYVTFLVCFGLVLSVFVWCWAVGWACVDRLLGCIIFVIRFVETIQLCYVRVVGLVVGVRSSSLLHGFVMGAGVVFVGCWVFLCVPVLLWCWALVVYVLVFLVVGLWVGLFVSHVSVVLVVLGWLILVECFWWFGGLCVIILLCYCLGLVSRWFWRIGTVCFIPFRSARSMFWVIAGFSVLGCWVLLGCLVTMNVVLCMCCC